MKSAQNSVLACLFNAHLLYASPILEQRQSPAQWLNNADFSSQQGYTTPTAKSGPMGPPGSDNFDNGYLSATDGSTWLAQTYSDQYNPAEYIWVQDDANTANCLINLHYMQGDGCISVKGSSCEATAGSSKILNARVGMQLSGDDSSSLQAASSAIVGSNVNSNMDGSDKKGMSSGGVTLYHNDMTTRTQMISTGNQPGWYGQVGINFGGGEKC